MDRSNYSELTLVEREDFSDDLARFQCEADHAVEFTPGQYATIGLHPSGMKRPLLRPYSVASAPGSPTLEFFIERVEDGQLTPRLWDLEPGDAVWMRNKIVGRFVLDTRRRNHVMAATVTGVGPYVSIARDQIRRLKTGEQDEPHRMLILHGGSRSWELGSYRQELAEMDASVDWLTYIPTISRPWDDPDWNGEVGRVEDVLRKHLDRSAFGPDDAAAYTCGHPQMIDKAQGILERTGFDEDVIHEEKYFVERVQTAA